MRTMKDDGLTPSDGGRRAQRTNRFPGVFSSRLVTVGVSVLAAVSLSFSFSPTSVADDLDDQKNALAAQIAEVRASMAAGEETLGAAQALLAKAREALTQAQSELATKIAARDAAVAEHDAQVVIYESAVAEAKTALARVAAGEADVARQQDAIALSVQLSVQQNQTLLSFSMLITDFDAAEANNRAQWADTIFTTANGELTRLESLQTQLELDRMAAATAEARAQVAKEAAAAKLAEAQALAEEAEVAAQDVAYQVEVCEWAEAAAQQEVDNFVARETELNSEIEQNAAEIRARNLAAAADAAKNGQSRPSDSNGMLAWPLDGGVITSPQGWRWHPIYGNYSYHEGVDIGISCWSKVYAAESGQVERARWSGELGNYIRINHGIIDGKSVDTGYAHLNDYAVSEGDWVYRGQVIGYVGSTGLSTGCHLHWNLYINGSAVDATQYV
jgi:murein DD-endopeptidase MepM/ murein hydrolase activator NlpD